MTRPNLHQITRNGAALLSLALVVGRPALASAADTPIPSSDATNLAQEGVLAYEEGDFQSAAAKLSQAYQVLQVPSIGLWLGRAYVKMGKLVEAAAVFHEVQRLSPNVGKVNVQTKALRDAAEDEATLAPRIPHLVVRLEGSPGTAPTSPRLDGGDISPAQTGVPQAVNPGSHEVAFMCGSNPQVLPVSVVEGETKTVPLTCPVPAGNSMAPGSQRTAATPQARSEAPSTAQPHHTSDSRRTIALVSFGVGAAGLAVGGISGIAAWHKASDLDSKGCRDSHCPAGVPQSEVQSLNDWRHVSTVGLAVGAVGVAAGLGFWFLAPQSKSNTRAALLVGPQTVNVVGEFE